MNPLILLASIDPQPQLWGISSFGWGVLVISITFWVVWAFYPGGIFSNIIPAAIWSMIAGLATWIIVDIIAGRTVMFEKIVH